MRLLELKLENYCQYESARFSLDPGLTVIKGLNGSGKSNWLNAIYFALTGDSYLEGKARTNMKRWGADKGSVTLEFMVGDDAYVITRMLHTSGVKLTGPGVELTKSKEATSFLTDLIKADADVLKVSSFMPQDKAGTLIFGTQTSRQAAFSRLFNLLKLEVVRTQIQKRHNSIPQFPDVSGLVKELELDIAAAKVNLENSKLSKEDDKFLQSGKAKYENWMPYKSVTTSASEKALAVSLAKESLSAKTEAYKAVSDKLEGLPAPVEMPADLVAKDSGYHRFKELCADFMRRVEDAARLERELESLDDVSIIPDLRDERLRESMACRDTAERLVLLRAGKCDKCGSEFPTDPESLAALERKVAEHRRREEEIDKELSRLQIAKTKAESLTTELSACRGVLASMETEINEKSHIYDNYDPSEYERLKARYDDSLRYKSERDELLQAKAMLSQAMQAAEGELARAEAMMAQPPDYSAEFMAKYEDAALRRASSAERVASLETEIRIKSEQLAARTKERDTSLACDMRRRMLSDLRDMLHVGRYPRLVLLSYKDKLAKLTQKYLDIFETPFNIHINDSLEWVCEFADNPEVPVFELSGGQKAMLLVSCRLAIAELLAGSVGIIAFDEPGAALDVETQMALTNAFDLVRKYLDSRNIQILVATHETRTEEVADSVITI